MLSNLISQLKQAGKSDQFYQVLEEIPRVRKEFGYPPLVTPTSQIVGTQAVMNVISGERYKMNPKESQALMRGEYGRLPAPVDEAVRKKVIGDAEVITCRPADLLKSELEEYKKQAAEYVTQPEDVLSYALFPQVAEKYFQYRQAQTMKLDNTLLKKDEALLPV
jgi:oxaloacetate decarboxylase alpha subunit